MVTTPSGISTYQRLLARAWDERDQIGAPTGFQSIFGRPSTGAETIFSDDAEVVDMDITRGSEGAGVLVPRGGIARSLGSLQKSLNEEKFSNINRVYPLSIELFDIASSQLNKRTSGEKLYAPMTREARLRKLSMRAMKETVKRSVRMFEILASQSARTGKQDAIIGTTDTDLQYDWSRNATNTHTVAVKWTNATPDILGDLDVAGDRLRVFGHVRAEAAIVGDSGMKALIRASEMQTLADNRRFTLMRIGGNNPVPARMQFLVDHGFDPRGYVETYKGRTIWLFTYDEGHDTSGTYVPYMPVDECLVFNVSARCDRYFGPPETLPLDSRMRAFYQDRFGLSPNAMPSVPMIKKAGVIMPGMFHFDAYPNGDNTGITHRTQSAPIFGTTHVDAFCLLDTLV